MRTDNFDKDGKLLCRKCGEYKTEDHFFSDKNQKYRNYKGTECKECQSLRKKKYWRTKEVSNLLNHARILVNGCKSRISRGKAKYQTLEFNISNEFILDLYNKQNGKCAISGLEMTYIEGSGRHLKNMSIDRINPNKGYTEDNVQLVCAQVNMMKSDMSLEELYMFCKAIIKNKNNE